MSTAVAMRGCMTMFEEEKKEKKKKELQAGGPRAWASLPYTLRCLENSHMFHDTHPEGKLNNTNQ